MSRETFCRRIVANLEGLARELEVLREQADAREHDL